MKVTKEKTVYQLAFMPRIFPVNCYLVEEEKELTLIDAALPFSVKGIIETAQKIGKPITRIVLTHAHGDHVGALDALKERLPESKVYISKRDARLLQGDTSLDDNEPQTPIRGGVPKSLKTRADVLLEEGDRIGSLVAITTPGHTPGSMSFLDKRNNSLIAGDALQVRGGVAVAGQLRVTFPFPAFGTWNKDVALQSVQKLLSYQPSLIAVGHGKMLKDPVDILEKAVMEAQQKLEGKDVGRSM